MDKQISFDPPRGMRDFYPADMVWRNKVFGAFREAGEAAGTYCEADRDDSCRRMGRICISREKPGADGKHSGREDSVAAAGRKYAGREDHAVAADPRWSGELRSAVYKYLLDAPMTAQDIYGRLGRPELKIQELF